MQVITLNIGLLNNPFSHGKATAFKSLSTAFDNIINVVRFQFPGESVIDSRYEHGTYNGESEPTLVVRIKTDDELTSTQVKTICRNLCQFFTQECLPFTSVRDCGSYYQAFYNGLIYHRDYDGKKYDFDPSFFINY